jgi:Mn-dependent DtxR family transcriptional regulator
MPPGGNYTQKQGQYPVHLLLHQGSRGAAHRGRHAAVFGVTPPAVHQMILGLEQGGLITRTPGAARSIRLTLPRGELPDLE